jgi:capsular exopolysaccharide synthesis family protein
MSDNNSSLSAASQEYTPEFLQEDEINLGEILTILKRRWIPFCLTFLGVVGGVGTWTFLQPPIFESSGQVLLQKQTDASALTGLAETLGELDPLSGKSNPLETEKQILLSNPILEKVIRRLDLKNQKGEPLSPQEFYEQILVDPINDTDILRVRMQDVDADKATRIVNELMKVYVDNDLEVSRSDYKAAKVFILQNLPRTERQIRDAELKLRLFKESNGLVNLPAETASTVQGLAELEGAITKTKAEYLQAQMQLDGLNQQLGGVGSSQALAIGQLSESAGVQSTLRELQAAEDQLAVSRTLLQPNHPELIDLEEKRASLQRTLDSRIVETIGTTANVSPGDLQFGKAVGLPLITELLKADVAAQSIAERLQSLEADYQAYQRRSTSLPRLEQVQSELERNLEVARLAFVKMRENLQLAELAESQNVGNVRILNHAVANDQPVAPKKSINLMMGVLLGLIAGTGVSLLIDSRDTRLRTIEDVRAVYNNHILLGTIPLFTKLKASENARASGLTLVMRDDPYSPVGETYRMLLTNLKFSRSDHPARTLVLSSALPGEGKSTTLANLALAIAEGGSRVLIIDADLRRPSQHQVWEIPNTYGLSNQLVEDRVGWGFNNQFIEDSPTNGHGLGHPLAGETHSASKRGPIEVSEGVEVLTAGAIPPNPTALLDSQRLRLIVEHYRSIYDYVLLDAPPLTVASDATIIGKVTDGLILVGRPNVVDRHAAQTVQEILKKLRQEVLGLVVNGVIPKNEPHSYYYYSQGYYSYSSEDGGMDNANSKVQNNATPKN